MQPRDQRSALWSYGHSSINSGAMYSGVPFIEVNTWVPVLILRAKPKSQSFATPFDSTRTFWGFRSLWEEKPAVIRDLICRVSRKSKVHDAIFGKIENYK